MTTASAALVDDVRNIAPERAAKKRTRGAAAEPPIRVSFAGGAAGRLDPVKPRDRVWAEVLQSLRDQKQPAYVEIDPDTGYITSVLLPRPFRVTAIRKTEAGDLEVDLEISHARHHLRHAQPGFERMLAILERARRDRSTVLVTETLDSSAIIDARPVAARAARRRRQPAR
jgi:hypothetical protein